MDAPRYFSAAEAARELGVKPATVYAYVSRGLIRSEPTAGATRARRYHAEDVRQLKASRARPRSAAAALRGALDWGGPLLDSALTLITEGALFYRGRDATGLARTRVLEEVALLLWTGAFRAPTDPATGAVPEAPTPAGVPRALRAVRAHPDLAAIDRMQAVLPLLAAADPAAHDTGARDGVATALALLRALAAAATGAEPGPEPVARTLAAAWTPGRAGTARLLDAAMVLCADHELNPSTLAARCAASTRASLYGVVSAGMATLQGTRHGGSAARAEGMLLEAASRGDAGEVVAARLRRGEGIPGFHHTLYPAGDPRAATLLAMVRAELPDAPGVTVSDAVAGRVGALVGTRPNIDFALATLSRALELPAGSALTLFALGRTVGWIAHALEQYGAGGVLRPRARYVGPAPLR